LNQRGNPTWEQAPGTESEQSRDAAQNDASAEIRSRAVKLLTTREHSRQELARKLLRRAYAADAINAVLDQLERDDLLSESRLIEQYVAERLRKGFGPVRIRFELREKGLSDLRTEPYLELSEESCLALISAAHNRRFGAETRKERQTLAKRARFLEYRGFPSHLVARFLGAED